MCGIFAFMGHQPLPIVKALRVLQILETGQEPGEKTPVGGHGAGIAYLNQKGKLTLTKVGKASIDSPVNSLQLQLKETANNSSHIILGHVRHASSEFTDTIQHKECTQPYQPKCAHSNFTLVSAHNGYLQNYQQLKNTLTQPHQFESLKHILIDSEVIAHLTEELLAKTKDTTKATHNLHEQIQGNNTIVIVCTNKNEAHLHAIQQGRTRGIIAWTNPENEVLICSREQPVEKVLNEFLTENNFQKTIKVNHKTPINLETHFNLKF